jgi:hypothetical protein
MKKSEAQPGKLRLVGMGLRAWKAGTPGDKARRLLRLGPCHSILDWPGENGGAMGIAPPKLS